MSTLLMFWASEFIFCQPKINGCWLFVLLSLLCDHLAGACCCVQGGRPHLCWPNTDPHWHHQFEPCRCLAMLGILGKGSGWQIASERWTDPGEQGHFQFQGVQKVSKGIDLWAGELHQSHSAWLYPSSVRSIAPASSCWHWMGQSEMFACWAWGLEARFWIGFFPPLPWDWRNLLRFLLLRGSFASSLLQRRWRNRGQK